MGDDLSRAEEEVFDAECRLPQGPLHTEAVRQVNTPPPPPPVFDTQQGANIWGYIIYYRAYLFRSNLHGHWKGLRKQSTRKGRHHNTRFFLSSHLDKGSRMGCMSSSYILARFISWMTAFSKCNYPLPPPPKGIICLYCLKCLQSCGINIHIQRPFFSSGF
jgi:hypothetical protein